MLVDNSLAVGHTCLASWCTPAWQEGVPDCHVGVHQLGKQVGLPAVPVYTSITGMHTCLPSWCHRHSGQAHLAAELVYTSMAGR
jgi:hypothetical protein